MLKSEIKLVKSKKNTYLCRKCNKEIIIEKNDYYNCKINLIQNADKDLSLSETFEINLCKDCADILFKKMFLELQIKFKNG